MAASILDVAKLSGYSKTTVSRAFLNPEQVKEDTRNRIFNAAKALNYSPNAIARAMVRQKNESIAFVIYEKHYPITLNPFYSAIFEHVQMEADRQGYQVSIVSNRDVGEPSRELFLRKRVDGIIIAGQTANDVILNFREQGMPVVLVNNHLDMDGLVCITSDDRGGSIQAMEHLISRGHTKIGLISGKLLPYVSAIRYNAYLEMMARSRLPIDDRFIKSVEPTQQAALACAKEMLSAPGRPTALFCTNDTIAVGAVKAALRLGLRVPQDVAVIGYDDSSVCTVIEPELTSINIKKSEMGRLSAKMLIAMINGEVPEQRHTVLKTRLVQRQST